MIQSEDLRQLEAKGMTEARLEEQLECFRNGFPYLRVKRAVSLYDGILHLTNKEVDDAVKVWEQYCDNHRVAKFVPASGAASRMFKDLYAFLNGTSDIPQDLPVMRFFNNIRSFPFYQILEKQCRKQYKKDITQLIIAGRYKDIVRMLLLPEGMGYGELPKGLLIFHRLNTSKYTPVEEHLAEGALYASNAKGDVFLTFTVSPEHRALFQALLDEKIPSYEKRYGVTYHVTLTEQKPSTDTVAVTPENELFRTDDGRLLFRPGGHGSLIENLNEVDADVVFIKNIDNVTHSGAKSPIIKEKKTLAGFLVIVQKKVFAYLRRLEKGKCSRAELEEMYGFLTSIFDCHMPDADLIPTDEELKAFLLNKFNRPIRVCAMVRNDGEPGGGPYEVYSKDGSLQLQILESSQIDHDDVEMDKIFLGSSFFNPVDLVCGLKNYKGERFDLRRYVDKQTGFISQKSKDGRELKALEHPGLWNGAMSDWNTVFVDADSSTFTPVKTVNDLLRPEHQK
jgi:hypothetical protein